VEHFVSLALKALALYLEAGLGWAAWFHFWGLRRVDPGIEGAGIVFRLLITPGLVALWPIMAVRCLSAAGNREILGGSDSPLPARALRSIHFRMAQILLLLLPLAFALAITLRPSSSPDRVESPPGTPASLPDPMSTVNRTSPHGSVPLTLSLHESADAAPPARLSPSLSCAPTHVRLLPRRRR
jgi:hypothetical protein